MRDPDAIREARRERAAVALIGAIALLAYAWAVRGDFVYDDLHSVRDNPALRSLANIPRFFVDVSLFSSLDCRLYRPVLLTSFAVDAAIGDMAPWTFKTTNVLLHMAAALLVYSIARALRVDRMRALIGACLLAAHPLASEAVNTVSGRSNLMMVVALLAGVRCHIAAMAGVRRSRVATVCCGVVALGCKEPGMILPVLLVILEGLRQIQERQRPLPLRDIGGRVLPVFGLVVVYVLVRGYLLGAGSFGVHDWQGTGELHAGHTRGLQTQLATMGILLPYTLQQFVAPFGLTMDPVIHYTDDWRSAPVWAGWLAMLWLTLIGLASPRRHPARVLGTCLAWGCALPWVIKPLNLPYLEHRLYGVVVGLCLVVMTALPAVTVPARLTRARVAVVLLLALFAGLSARRSMEFESGEHLWAVELERNQGSKVAMAGMAVCRMQQRRYAEARPYLIQLVSEYPDRVDARINLAECELQSGTAGDPAVAVEQAEFLVERAPRNPFHRLTLSRAQAALAARTGDPQLFDRAVETAMSCLEVAPPKGLVYRTAAGARRLQGRIPDAIAILDASVARGLDHWTVLLDRSDLLLAAGRIDEARRDLRRARQQSPFEPAVLAALRRVQRSPAVRPPR